MVSTLLSTSDSCVTAGKGMATTWTLAGSTTAYAGTLTTTDGYKITASFTWVAITGVSTNTAGETLGTNACGFGTCVESLDAAGTRIASTVTDKGNNALCHWFYTKAGATSTAGTASTGSHWGESKFLTYTQWGTTSGGGVIGSTMKTNGTSISTSYGHTLTPTTVTTFAAGTYTMLWYQPTYAATYSSTALRRYNGGTADANKVKPYCVGLRLLATTTVLSSTDITAASSSGTSGVVTLTGASAIAAGAIAFGVAALAF